MNTPNNPGRRDEAKGVAEQAALWYTLFEGEPQAVDHAAFVQWISESPLHVRAFLNVTATDRLLETIDPEHQLQILDVPPREAAADVVSLYHARQEDHDVPPAGQHVKQSRRAPLAMGLAAVISILAVGLWLGTPFLTGSRTYATAVGEQRGIKLVDGSFVQLNTRSRIEVRFARQAREVHLLEGEALFAVAHDPTRPFRVWSADALIQAVGTQFNVYRRSDGTTVSVIEGVVQISKDSAPLDHPVSGINAQVSADVPTPLTAGESVNLASDGKVAWRGHANVARVTAWRQRQLVFDEDTLADIATEFNRYNRTPQIRIEGEAVRKRRYAAVFDADDPQSLLQFLEKDPDLAFETRGDELIITVRKNMAQAAKLMQSDLLSR